MAVFKRGYQRYNGPLASRFQRMMALPRFAWQRLLQSRLFLGALILSMFWPLLCACFIYVGFHSELWQGLGPGLASLLEVNGRFFLIFMNFQATLAVLLAALAGPGLIAPDLANNGLPLYFSRPLTRLEYVLARMLTLAGMLSLITWVPGLMLFGMASGMAGWSWFGEHWNIGAGILAGFLLWIALVSLVALASSAYVKWRIIAGAVVLAFFFITAGAAEMINAVFRDTWGSLFNPARLLYRIWCLMLDVTPPDGPETWASVAALLTLAALLAWVLERKLRPVEVIT